ncbi:acyltransferase [Arcicella aquatica]|uniref:Acyltransferase n=1 Tax=Arcicella aquatica TaxID=217141 RepID=A0ABU5QMJ1_9BACT|nr:acyltransferase [Arcicella aquatica]MEA5258270.1 acyltransferase [Arcicella aquatica]
MQKSHQSVYFPNLNGVRFIAAFSVLIHHTEQIKYLMGLENFYDFFILKNMGKLGVGLFFVLSGFLITYLLLSEKNRRGDISTKDFYIRRILRIWPLYYIIVLLAFFVFPEFSFFYGPLGNDFNYDTNFYKRLPFFLLFLPNVGFVFYRAPYLCAQTWSIGIEEQFYAIWPWIIKRKNPLKSFLIVVSVFVAIVGSTSFYFLKLSDLPEATKAKIYENLALFFSQFRILTMVIGGIGAYLVFSKQEKILSFLFKKSTQIIVYTITVLIIGSNVYIPGFNLEFHGFFFCYFIINVAANPNTILNLETPIIHYLGKISYGIYIYHSAVIVFCINAIHYFLGNNLSLPVFNVILYTSAIGLTVLVCDLSFRFIETPLLRLKERFNR